MKHAVSTGGVAHLWLHPHNLITAKGQVELFEDAISRVAEFRNSELIKAMTQSDYCKEIVQQS